MIIHVIKYKADITIATEHSSHSISEISELITSLIRERYSASQVEAIVNNYLADTTNEEYLKEFNDMQEWRKEVKSIAKKVNDFIQENDLINKPDGVYEVKD